MAQRVVRRTLSRTTPRTRAELRAEDPALSDQTLAHRCRITVPSVRKWRAGLDGRSLASACAAALHTERGPGSGGEKDAPVLPKTVKDYAPGFVHVDIKYLPQTAEETARRYLFVAIDRATRWVYLRIYADQSEKSSTDFLHRLPVAAPMKIEKVLTDNGRQFTDRFTGRRGAPSGAHAFDRGCARRTSAHRLITPRHPQTNGRVERFNGRVSDILATPRFRSREDLQTALARYLILYNEHLPQRALGHNTPLQARHAWRKERPDLFVKRLKNQAGLNTVANH